MRETIQATLQEPGCRAYSYTEDVTVPDLFRVMELWDSRDALEAHFATPHMRQWLAALEELGFFDRRISLYEVGAAQEL